jgi:flavorubredoxin
MINKPLTTDIHYFGANDTTTEKFEALWDIPQGVSYNCYLIQDDKIALIDTVESKFSQELITELKTVLNGQNLDYLILNHMEPDHSGTIELIRQEFPQVTLVGNHKTAGFVQGFYQIPENQVQQIKSGDELSLGKHNLQFIQTPMVHWPESMITYDQTSQVVFSSDIFGGYKTVDEQPLADKREDLSEYIDEAREYFATVLGAYTRPAKRALKQVADLEPKVIAPAHGLVWQKSASKILDLYQQWAQYQAEPGVTIIYGSMYGHTEDMAKKINNQLKEQDIDTKLINAAYTPTSEMLNAVWQYQGVIIGSCTYTNDLFPPVKHLLSALEERNLENRFLGLFGSYSWTGGAMRYLKKFAQSSKLELVEPQFRTQYTLDQEAEQSLKQMVEAVVKKIT